jgi:hypothetical protein
LIRRNDVLDLKEWARKTIVDSPFLPEDMKEQCKRIIDGENKNEV